MFEQVAWWEVQATPVVVRAAKVLVGTVNIAQQLSFDAF
jgi:hypothetical protein